MSMHNLIIFLSILVLGSFVINYANAEQSIPDWVKNTAGWWAEDAISETEFVSAIEFLIKEDIIEVYILQSDENNQGVPDWVKNTAGWWAKDAISETEFVSAIKFLIKVNIISVEKENLADEWEYLSVEIIPSTKEITYNKDGLRNYEIKEKGINEYRIIMVGGSTTFGTGVGDNETIPYYLENEFKKMSIDKDVRVINAGIPSAWSETELDFIYGKLVKLEPDLFIVYDGWNDLDRYVGSLNFAANPTYWNERWKTTCKELSEEGIETMIILQPFLGTGNRMVTEQEFLHYYPREKIHERYLVTYDLYAEKINGLNEDCSKAVDLRNIFDGVSQPLYWDLVHLGAEGNRLAAKEIFNYSKDLVDEVEKEYYYEKELDGKSNNLKRVSGENLDLNSKFIELTNYDFSGADLSNFDFRFSKISNVSFQGADLTNAKFSRSDLEDINFNDAILKNTDFFGVKLSNGKFMNANLKDSDFRAMNIVTSVFKNTNLENTDFSNSVIINSEFSSSNLVNSKFNSSKLLGNNFKNLDFSTTDISGVPKDNTWFAGSDLTNVNFYKTDLTEVNFSMYYYNNEVFGGTNLTEVDFHLNPSANNAIFSQIPFARYDDEAMKESHYIITDRFILKEEIEPRVNEITDCLWNGATTELQDLCVIEVGKKIGTTKKIDYKISDIKKHAVKLVGVNFSGLNLSKFSFSDDLVSFFPSFSGATPVKSNNMIGLDLQNADLSNSNLENVDLSFSNLDGANLSGANLTNSNLHETSLNNVNFAGALLKCKNNTICE